MKKWATTKREVLSSYNTCLCVSYCGLQNLLAWESPCAYTHGVYGWNADVYDMSIIGYSGVAIVTGYRPFGTHVDFDLVRKYESLAEKVDRFDKRDDLRVLIKQFVEEATS